ncbi:Pimeloyl-ACP methyl ester carboxylesterase [Aquimarina amphilecti]|uniref:Pimeloyl-ACP methyl ester carboxylesterase n=1 Tax=Aquimarina amphilecti TaxID=1038014 RepID=A0A1H7HGS4_AQUAM|nr:alpha/beta fold hydrolase [Aquimarina amphilecti]SEK48120.1 Pimeloyl-ACP methyl ester carboxylesterase [Aquimarina amphilecti]
MKSLFRTVKGKKEILSLYDQKLAELKIQYEYLKIDSSFGKTNIIATGISSKPPIILIHGSNGCAPIAIQTYPNLHKSFRVYAIDVLAQPNKSAETRLSMKDDSYGKWINEIINSLKIENVILAGFSFGGLIILKALEFDESKIKEVYLSSPAYIINGNPLKTLFKIFIPMKRFIKTNRSKFIEQFLSEVFTERDEFAVKFLSKVFKHFKMDFTPVPVIDSKKGNSIITPITLFAGEKDILFPGKKMIKRAQKIFPSLKSVMLINNSKHVQSGLQNNLIEKTIIENSL